MIIADSIANAKDAAELVDVDYEVLPVTREYGPGAANPEAPRLFDDARSNVCLDAYARRR